MFLKVIYYLLIEMSHAMNYVANIVGKQNIPPIQATSVQIQKNINY